MLAEFDAHMLQRVAFASVLVLAWKVVRRTVLVEKRQNLHGGVGWLFWLDVGFINHAGREIRCTITSSSVHSYL